jgi:hypothetical protein
MIRFACFLLFFLWVVRAPYAYRDSIRTSVLNKLPEVYLPNQERERSQAFIYATENYKAGDRRRTKAVTDLALIRWQQNLLADADRLYRAVLNETQAPAGANREWKETMLHLAALSNAQERFDQATWYYVQILNYDKKYLPKNDACIGLDNNNLGLSTYLKALSKNRGEERTKLLKQADDYYKQALQIYRTQPNTQQEVAVVLYNEHLALRDLGDWEDSKSAMLQATAIDTKCRHGNSEL